MDVLQSCFLRVLIKRLIWVDLFSRKERSREEVCIKKDSKPKEDCNKHLEDLYSFLRLAVRLGGGEHTPELWGQIVVLNVLRIVFKLIRHWPNFHHYDLRYRYNEIAFNKLKSFMHTSLSLEPSKQKKKKVTLDTSHF